MNNKLKIQVEWVGEADLSLDNSFGTIASQKNVAIQFTLGIHEGHETGWFEFYDVETGGEDWYAEGGLWFDEGGVWDYDGVYSLPTEIIMKLKSMGFNTDDIE